MPLLSSALENVGSAKSLETRAGTRRDHQGPLPSSGVGGWYGARGVLVIMP